MQQRAIKTKIKSTTSIKKITKTMEMISVTKMKKTMSFADAYKDFIFKAKNILDIVSSQSKGTDTDIVNVFNINNSIDKNLYIIIGGQKGLAGSYNVNLFRYLNKLNIDRERTDFISVNRYGEKIVKKFLNKNKDNLKMSFVGKSFKEKESRIIFDKTSQLFIEGKYKNIFILYTDFISATKQEVKCISLLPFDVLDIDDVLGIKENSNTDNKKIQQSIISRDDINTKYLFEPDFSNIVKNSIKLLLSSYILYAYTRSETAEHISRMNAMHSASENAGELIFDLKLLYNKSRQASITQEISEISAGASV